jgi:DNA repair photolyase/catechol 2,3-dioxygenase-like lactoylglutathione lyase family enzyme
MARSTEAVQHPSASPLPRTPAGGYVDDATDLLGLVVEHERRRGRGALSNTTGRYEPMARVAFDDGWSSLEELPPFKTTVSADATRKIITRNDSPDIGFDRSINPYRGCEHGCVYCFARPTHAYLGLSAGLDFESRLFVKPEAAELLQRELAAPGYKPRIIAIGTNTDPYQPIERKYQVMRRILEVLDGAGHPVGIVTKSALVLRDLDILARMAQRNLVKVALSVTTLDAGLARKMEPRAATPMRRLETLRRLSAAGVPTSVMVAPVIPALNDTEIERILDAAHAAGVGEAGYVLLRLPLELRDLFREWLKESYPHREEHVFKLIREMRGGKDYDPKWGERMKGTGPYAWMIGRRFEMACERLGLNETKSKLTTGHFRPPQAGQRATEFVRPMKGPDAALSLVTLGVSDLARSIAFYEALGFRRKVKSAEGVGFFQATGCALSVFPRASLAEDAAVPDDGAAQGFRGVALAWNCRAEAEVDAAIERARRAGATVPKPARKTFWGG